MQFPLRFYSYVEWTLDFEVTFGHLEAGEYFVVKKVMRTADMSIGSYGFLQGGVSQIERRFDIVEPSFFRKVLRRYAL